MKAVDMMTRNQNG